MLCETYPKVKKKFVEAGFVFVFFCREGDWLVLTFVPISFKIKATESVQAADVSGLFRGLAQYTGRAQPTDENRESGTDEKALVAVRGYYPPDGFLLYFNYLKQGLSSDYIIEWMRHKVR